MILVVLSSLALLQLASAAPQVVTTTYNDAEYPNCPLQDCPSLKGMCFNDSCSNNAGLYGRWLVSASSWSGPRESRCHRCKRLEQIQVEAPNFQPDSLASRQF